MGNSKNEKNSRAPSRKTAIEDSSEFPHDIFHGMSEYERTERPFSIVSAGNASVEPQTAASDECLTWANTAASAAATTTVSISSNSNGGGGDGGSSSNSNRRTDGSQKQQQ
ncbi:hypothetical protein HZH68_006808 [Vespula germanica]|uniref:Uncharacterized protein n=1 Tax=Vespula germanica TaxID=30212 RepID=A0A834NDG0_VESGE|nr:hypothetical protein HZH68_006808 [Vespula germanica]